MNTNIKIAGSIFLLAAAALLLTFYSSYSPINKGIADNVEQAYFENANSAMASADAFLYRAYTDLAELSENPALKDENSKEAQILPALQEFIGKKKHFKSVSFLDLNGARIAGTELAGAGSGNGVLEFRKDFIGGRKYIFGHSELSSIENPTITAGLLVENNGRPAGFLMAEIRASEMKALLGGFAASVALLDKGGIVAVSNTPIYTEGIKLSGMDAVRQGLMGKSGMLYEQNPYLGGEAFTAFASERDRADFKGNGWLLIYSVEQRTMNPATASFSRNFAYAGTILVMMAALVAYYLSRETEKPMKALESALKDAMAGKDVRLSESGGIESEATLKYFENVIEDLNKSKRVIDEYGKIMEEKVGKKTKDIEDTKIALLNALEDTTKTKERLKKNYSKLKKQNEQKDQFISIAAHELKTPLSAIHGFSDLLMKSSKELGPEKTSDYLGIISKESIRLSTLVTDILDLSRVDLGTVKYDMKEINLRSVLSNASKSIEMQMKEKGLKFETEINRNLPKIAVDENKFTQILINLLTNAMKYTLKGTVVFKAYNDNNSLHLIFKDTGIGMSKEGMKHLFERFYRVETEVTKSIPGSGLGLSLCKEYAEAMGGKIWVESEAGKGSTFHVVFPGK